MYEREMLAFQLSGESEIARLEDSIEFQKKLVESEWSAFESQTTKSILSKPLPGYWVFQRDRKTGNIYYYNTKSNFSQDEHPYLKFVRVNLESERTIVDQKLEDFCSQCEQKILSIKDAITLQRETKELEKLRVFNGTDNEEID